MVLNQRVTKIETSVNDLDRLVIKGIVESYNSTTDKYTITLAGYGDTYTISDVIYQPVFRSILVEGETDSARGHRHDISFRVEMPKPVVDDEIIAIKIKKGRPDTWAIIGVIYDNTE